MKKTILFYLFIICSISLFSQTHQDYYISGIHNMDNGKYVDAIKDFSSALDKNQKFEEAYLKRGSCYEVLNDYKNALFDYSKAIKLDPNNDLALFNRGILRERIRNYETAVQDFTAIIDLKTKLLPLAYYNRALSKLSMNDVENACVDLSKAADLGVKNASEIFIYTCQ